MSDSTKVFSAWLAKRRADAKMSYRTLADKSGVNVATIFEIEKGGSSPTLRTVERLCAAFGVSMEAALRVRSKKEAKEVTT